MLKEEFEKLTNFTPQEVIATGAKIADVSFLLMLAFQLLRGYLGRSVNFHYNGLTSGVHKSKTHFPGGIAGDFYLDPKEGKVNPRVVVFFMLLAGFKGIGVYLNKDGSYSFHGDLRTNFSDWFRDRSGEYKKDTSIFVSGISG